MLKPLISIVYLYEEAGSNEPAFSYQTWVIGGGGPLLVDTNILVAFYACQGYAFYLQTVIRIKKYDFAASAVFAWLLYARIV